MDKYLLVWNFLRWHKYERPLYGLRFLLGGSINFNSGNYVLSYALLNSIHPTCGTYVVHVYPKSRLATWILRDLHRHIFAMTQRRCQWCSTFYYRRGRRWGDPHTPAALPEAARGRTHYTPLVVGCHTPRTALVWSTILLPSQDAPQILQNPRLFVAPGGRYIDVPGGNIPPGTPCCHYQNWTLPPPPFFHSILETAQPSMCVALLVVFISVRVILLSTLSSTSLNNPVGLFSCPVRKLLMPLWHLGATSWWW